MLERRKLGGAKLAAATRRGTPGGPGQKSCQGLFAAAARRARTGRPRTVGEGLALVALLLWATTAGMRENGDREFGRTIRREGGGGGRGFLGGRLLTWKKGGARAAPGARDQWEAVASPVTASLCRASRRIRAHGRSRRARKRGGEGPLPDSLLSFFFGSSSGNAREREQRAPWAVVGLGEASAGDPLVGGL